MRPITEKISFKKNSKIDALIFNFFQNLGEALSAGNLENIKKCWALPFYALGDRMVKSVNTTDDFNNFFSGTNKEYNKRGIAEARPEVVRTQWLTDQIVVVQVRWPYINRSGTEIGEESSAYTLKLDQNGKFKIHMVTMLGEKMSDRTQTH